MFEMAAIAAADKAWFWLPRTGLQGAKPMVVGRLSIKIQESAKTAVATPFVVVCS